jgi:hypothetical protein
MGCDPIGFAGADLAYTNDRPYCHGVTFEEDWRRLAHWGEPVTQQFRETIDRYEAVYETDVGGDQVRTAPHLRTFRDWLVEQMGKETARRFINATGGGILQGGSVGQTTPEGLLAWLPPADPALRRLAQDRYQPHDTTEVAAAVDSLLRGIEAQAPDACGVLTDWEQFAPGITRNAVVDTLDGARRALAPNAPQSLEAARPGGESRSGSEAAYARPTFEEGWLQQLTSAMPLVPLRLPPERMQVAPSGARVFRFRTTAARIISCAMRPPDGAVAEDGRPLAQAADLGQVVAGSYSVCRDEVHFRALDDTDPRRNGREYTLLVPPTVAYLENLAFDEILSNGV